MRKVLLVSILGLYSLCLSAQQYLQGKVRVVNSFPDYKVRVVNSFPDLNVQKVTSTPTKCGQWQFVNSFEDFTIQFVDAFEDFSIQYVNAFPGLPSGSSRAKNELSKTTNATAQSSSYNKTAVIRYSAPCPRPKHDIVVSKDKKWFAVPHLCKGDSLTWYPTTARVQFVDSAVNATFVYHYSPHGALLNFCVQLTDSVPTQWCEWQVVDANPDFTLHEYDQGRLPDFLIDFIRDSDEIKMPQIFQYNW